MKGHKTTAILYPKLKQLIQIDSGLAGLLPKLWKKNIHTLFSCQGYSRARGPYGSNFAYIFFLSEKSAAKFMMKTLGVPAAWNSHGGVPNKDIWCWEISPNYFLKNRKYKPSGKWNYVVRFPNKHIKTLEVIFGAK